MLNYACHVNALYMNMSCSLWSIECFRCYVWNKMIIYYFVCNARKSGVCKRIALDWTLLVKLMSCSDFYWQPPHLFFKKLNLNIRCLLIWRDSSLLPCKKRITRCSPFTSHRTVQRRNITICHLNKAHGLLWVAPCRVHHLWVKANYCTFVGHHVHFWTWISPKSLTLDYYLCV